ncbi:MAG: trypsin-like peptidase domain-containing protein [Herbinix sp.]|nr:trypsin-like peptidase domain-containing protein [Herbinix sp.]
MNEEYNNNQSGEYNNNSENPNNNPDSYLNQRNEQNLVYGYTTGNFNSYDNMSQMNAQTNNNDPYTVYPNPQVNDEKKPKKKRKVPGVFKLTAAAVAFGLIAGTVFQGYYLVMKATGNIAQNDSNNVKVAEVTQSTDSGDTIVPASTTSSDDVVTDVSNIVDNVMPSIVAINSSGTSTSYDVFGRAYSEQVGGSGSGIIIAQNASELLIVTNNHVIEGATSVEIVFTDETKASAEIKGADANADLAVLSVDMNDLSKDTVASIKVATLGDSDKVEAGDMAIAIGNALGYGQSVTVGYISAVNREVTIDENTMTLLQTDAAINPGNSGGALLNTQGQVIGINSVKYASAEVEGMGYAIPISNALPMINELMNRETISADKQGFLGIDASTAQNVTEDYATRFDMPVGVYVNDVIADSPAEAAGLEQGDIITGVDDAKIETIDDLVNVLSYKKAGQTIDLKIQVKSGGNYQEKTLQVTLVKKN